MGDLLISVPLCTEAGVSGAVGCFGVAYDSIMYLNEFKGGTFFDAGWSGWSSSGGLVHGIGCAEFGRNAAQVNYACGVAALNDSGFWTNEYNGSSWGSWVQQGTATFIGNPSCVALNTTVTPGQVMCVMLQENGTAVSIVGP